MLHDRGVPYRVGEGKGNGGDLRVGQAATGSPRVTLTVEAGVTLRFIPAGRLLMSAAGSSATGVLIASGSASKPIVFTSAAASPAPGDWVGLWFDGIPDPSDRISFAQILYAGGPSAAKSFHCDVGTGGTMQEQEDAALILFGEPSSAFITNSTIGFSAGYGIDRGWHGDPMDLTASNTFNQDARCNQSYPRAQDGSCPQNVPCI